MKTIAFKIVGGVGGKTKIEGTLADLYVRLPYVTFNGLVPPFDIAHDLFRRGVFDAGMSGGCEWQPFELTKTDYEEFVEDLLTHQGYDPTLTNRLSLRVDDRRCSDGQSFKSWLLRSTQDAD